MWDLRAKQFFKSEEDFHRGMKLLVQYLSATSAGQSFEEISKEFLDQLDDTTDYESSLLTNAAQYHASKQLDAGTTPYKSQPTIYDNEISKIGELVNEKILSLIPKQNTHNILLSEACEKFIATHRSGWKATGGMEQSYRTTMFPFLIDIVGDIPTSDMKKIHISDLVEILHVYPANKNKKFEYQYLSAKDFINIDTPDEDRMSPITKKKYLTQIGSFLRWLKLSDFTSIDLDAPLKIKIQTARPVDQRSAFNKDELRKIFNSKEYLQGRHSTASRFWVPLIGIFTGARLNEICQLSVNDIQEEPSKKRWVISFNEDITDNPKKSIKRTHHSRLVPIHKSLLELGFIDYVKATKKKHKRLFPELPYVNDANKYGDRLQRWFNRTYLKSKKHCAITREGTSFHSLRHTVMSHLATDHKVTGNQVASGMGHATKGNEFDIRYAKSGDYNAYAKYFDLIDFKSAFDLKLIKPWKFHAFARIAK
jgi:integrase